MIYHRMIYTSSAILSTPFAESAALLFVLATSPIRGTYRSNMLRLRSLKYISTSSNVRSSVSGIAKNMKTKLCKCIVINCCEPRTSNYLYCLPNH